MQAFTGPNMTQTGILVAAILVALLYRHRYLFAPVGFARSLFKTLPVGLYAGFALASEGGGLLFAAFFLSALGDWLLSRDDRYFLHGLAAFLAGHVAFVALFLGFPAQSGPSVWMLQGGAVILASGFGVLLWPKTGRFRWPVTGYIGVIGVMAVSSARFAGTDPLVTTGAFMFVVSDAILASRMFLVRETSPKSDILGVLVWWTYILAQSALLIGLHQIV